jgi:hypothetical protein
MRTRRSVRNQNSLYRQLGTPSRAEFFLMQAAPDLQNAVSLALSEWDLFQVISSDTRERMRLALAKSKRTEALVQVVQGEGKAWVGFDRLSKITAPVDTVRETGLIKIG